MIIEPKKSPLAPFIEVYDEQGNYIRGAFWVDTEKKTAKAYLFKEDGQPLIIREPIETVIAQDLFDDGTPRYIEVRPRYVAKIAVGDLNNVTIRLKPDFPSNLKSLLPPELQFFSHCFGE